MDGIQSELIINMSTLTSTTSNNRPTLGASDVGKSYFETDSQKILVWDGSAWNEWNNDLVVSPGFNNNFSASLDGTDDMINCGAVTDLAGATAFTLAFWYKPATSGAGVAIGMRQNSTNMYVFFNNNVYIKASNVGGTNVSYTAPTGTNWSYYVLSYSAGSATLYIDGSSAMSSSSFAPSLPTSTSTNFYIGSYGGLTGTYTSEGLFDEVALWSSSLDSSNAAAIYNGGTEGFDVTSNGGNYDQASNLLAYWRCGDGSNDTSTTGSPTDSAVIGTVKNVANPGTNDGSGANGATYASKSADSTNVPY